MCYYFYLKLFKFLSISFWSTIFFCVVILIYTLFIHSFIYFCCVFVLCAYICLCIIYANTQRSFHCFEGYFFCSRSWGPVSYSIACQHKYWSSVEKGDFQFGMSNCQIPSENPLSFSQIWIICRLLLLCIISS